jgi:hypothetical protein
MHIVNRFPNGLPLMNEQSLTAAPIVQCEGSGEDVENIWNGMIVPWQRGMCCDRHLEGCELRLAGRLVRIGFAIPGLRCLQQSFTLGSRNFRGGLLSNNN